MRLKKRIPALAAAGLMCATFGLAFAGDGVEAQTETVQAAPILFTAIDGNREFSGRMIVRPVQMMDMQKNGMDQLDAQRNADEARTVIDQYNLQNYVWQTDEYIIYVPANKTENEVSQALMATGLFQYAEPDWTVYPIDCPDDPQLNSQYHHDANIMQSCDAWDIHTGDPTTTVGICDTGIFAGHADLQLHRKEGYNAVDQQWENDGGQIDDINGHGTNTTGCAAANGDNGVGVSGVGWNLSHRMMRVSNSSGGSSSLSTLQHGARTSIEAGDQVASVSYSGVDANSNLTTATYIKSINGLLVWAAGNDNRNISLSDRDADDIIVASATDSGDNRASFSNFGRMVDVGAPGVSVFTTNRSGGYSGVSGTSFSCPLTAGLCALIWSANPSLTPDEVEAILKSGADDIGSTGIDDQFGYGRINSFGSLGLVSRAVVFSYPDGFPASINPAGGDTVRVMIEGEDESPDTGTGMFYWNDGSGWNSSAMNYLGGDLYDATFGATTCGNDVSFYVSIETTIGNTYTNPSDAPASSYNTLSANGINTVFADDFQTNKGWTVENVALDDGEWQRGVPANGDRGDPSADSDGSGQCYVTDNVAGNSDVDGGPTRLISPTMDLTGTDSTVYYDRWFYNDDNDADRLTVEVSNDGGSNWTTVESIGHSGETWVSASFRVLDFVTPTSQMVVRFSATDNPNDSVTEAGIDAFRVEEVDCGGGPSDCLTLAVDNLVAGGSAAFTITDGDSGVRAVTVYGLQAGVTVVNNVSGYCATFNIKGVSQSKVLGGLNQVFDGSGEISFNVNIPNGTAGTTVYFQSAMQDTCPDECVSNLVQAVIQ